MDKMVWSQFRCILNKDKNNLIIQALGSVYVGDFYFIKALEYNFYHPFDRLLKRMPVLSTTFTRISLDNEPFYNVLYTRSKSK